MAVQVDSDEPVLTITLDRPDHLNACTRELHAELAAALKQARAPEVRAVILTGAGRGFCVGQDLGEVRADGGGGNDARLREQYNPNVRALRALEKPVIAAVNGVCAGAGISLAVACDVRIASAQAKFVPAFANIGLVPDAGASLHLVQLLGYARAFEWMTSGRHLPADEALALGLVGEVVAPEALLSSACERAAALAAWPGVGVGLTKRLMRHALGATLDEQLELEAQLQGVAASRPEYEAALDAFLSRSASRG
jgi:2-(1,2-epoxy-1,2-dihydrophenyl)acetyl-CoA isomerase